MNIEEIDKKIEELQKKKKELKSQIAKQTENTSQWLDVSDVLPNCEVELNVHDKNRSWNDLGLKDKEDQLLSAEQCIALANSKYVSQLKMDGTSSQDDFFIKQPFNTNRTKGYVAGFDAYSDWADLSCVRNPTDADSSLGVRFVRKKISKKLRERYSIVEKSAPESEGKHEIPR
ncbi:MAG: hypothetical protein AABY22_32680 [Nanoarchaeota archaeon]